MAVEAKTVMRPETQFILNGETVRTRAAQGLLVLDYLRDRAGLYGTKEGCREGDCGACTVLVGTLDGDSTRYLPMTSCLIPLGELHGRHLVSIEGLNLDGLNPAQQAIVDAGATQCGFCTPGIVVSLTGLLLQPETMAPAQGTAKALSGHLCRCTGYRSLKAAGVAMQESVGETTGIESLVAAGVLPDTFSGITLRLKAIPPRAITNGQPAAGLALAGGTDLYIQHGAAVEQGRVDLLGQRPELQGITRETDYIRLGAMTTFEQFAAHPDIAALVPDIKLIMDQIASWQIRSRATIGGNIVNASPIADLTIMLLALDAQLELASGNDQRSLPLRKFYRGYKKLDLAPGEILSAVRIPLPEADTRFHFEKVSKRWNLDIASVNSALAITVVDGRIEALRLAMGGVAPVPLFLADTCRLLTGKPLSVATVREALEAVQAEIAPISDIRGGAEYKRLLARQLTMLHFVALFPETVPVEEFYAAN